MMANPFIRYILFTDSDGSLEGTMLSCSLIMKESSRESDGVHKLTVSLVPTDTIAGPDRLTFRPDNHYFCYQIFNLSSHDLQRLVSDADTALPILA